MLAKENPFRMLMTYVLIFSNAMPTFTVLSGHRELSCAVPDISRAYPEFQFNEELESAISEFAPQTMREVKDRKLLSNLTYEKVFWAGKIENPMVSV